MELEHSMGWAFRSLNGAGTFKGMGIQNTGWCWDIPWDGHNRCGYSWHKTSQSHTPRSHCNTRDSVMRHGQSLQSCIFLHSSLALRYGATPVLIFDQPCGGKPRRSLAMSHLTVSHGQSSYGLGDFTQK